MLLFFTVNALRSFKILSTLHLQPTAVHRALTVLVVRVAFNKTHGLFKKTETIITSMAEALCDVGVERCIVVVEVKHR